MSSFELSHIFVLDCGRQPLRRLQGPSENTRRTSDGKDNLFVESPNSNSKVLYVAPKVSRRMDLTYPTIFTSGEEFVPVEQWLGETLKGVTSFQLLRRIFMPSETVIVVCQSQIHASRAINRIQRHRPVGLQAVLNSENECNNQSGGSSNDQNAEPWRRSDHLEMTPLTFDRLEILCMSAPQSIHGLIAELSEMSRNILRRPSVVNTKVFHRMVTTVVRGNVRKDLFQARVSTGAPKSSLQGNPNGSTSIVKSDLHVADVIESKEQTNQTSNTATDALQSSAPVHDAPCSLSLLRSVRSRSAPHVSSTKIKKHNIVRSRSLSPCGSTTTHKTCDHLV